jgi:regulatory protein
MACNEHEEDFERAREAAYKFLAYRPRTEYEMTENLCRKGFDSETVSQVIKSLRDYRMLDDEAYAENYVARKNSRPRPVLAGELKNLGIRESIINRVLEGVDSGAEFRIALALAMGKRKRKGKEYSPGSIAALLRRRGFSQETVDRVCDYLENLRQP